MNFLRGKKLIIVYNDETKKYACLLEQLIAEYSRGDEVVKLGDLQDVGLWNQGHFLENEINISIKQCFVFIGKTKETEPYFYGMEDKLLFGNYGISLYRHGNMFGIDVENRSLDEKEYNDFIKYSEDKVEKFKKRASLMKIDKETRDSIINSISGFFKDVVNNNRFSLKKRMENIILDQQYKFGLFYFLEEELRSLIGDNDE